MIPVAPPCGNVAAYYLPARKSSTPHTSAIERDRDDELIGPGELLDEGLTPEDAQAVLGPHSALTRREVEDRLAMLRCERRAPR
jgi:hypothetical protein